MSPSLVIITYNNRKGHQHALHHIIHHWPHHRQHHLLNKASHIMKTLIIIAFASLLCLGGCNVTTQHAPVYRAPVYRAPVYRAPVCRTPVYRAPVRVVYQPAPYVRHYRSTRSVYQSPYMRRHICVR